MDCNFEFVGSHVVPRGLTGIRVTIPTHTDEFLITARFGVDRVSQIGVLSARKFDQGGEHDGDSELSELSIIGVRARNFITTDVGGSPRLGSRNVLAFLRFPDGRTHRVHERFAVKPRSSYLDCLNVHNAAAGTVLHRDQHVQAFVYVGAANEVGGRTTLPPTPQLLPLPEGCTNSRAIAIDDNGGVLVLADVGNGKQTHGYYYPDPLSEDPPWPLRHYNDRSNEPLAMAVPETSVSSGVIIVGATEGRPGHRLPAYWVINREKKAGTHHPLRTLGGQTGDACAAREVGKHYEVYGATATKSGQFRATYWPTLHSPPIDVNEIVDWKGAELPADLVLRQACVVDVHGQLICHGETGYSGYFVLLNRVK